jgi:hypothetical protein
MWTTQERIMSYLNKINIQDYNTVRCQIIAHVNAIEKKNIQHTDIMSPRDISGLL